MPTNPAATCAWCKGPLPPTARRDSKCCSVRCRQARHRFLTQVGRAEPVAAGHPRRLAYADPPYPGLSKRYYGDHRDYAGEVDHVELVAHLETFDAWALSTSARALQHVLGLCPSTVRVAAWVRGERPNQAAVVPQNAWEPVILGGDLTTRRVALDHGSPVAEDLPDASRATAAPGDASAAALHDASPSPAYDVSTWLPRRLDALVYHSRPRTTDPDRVIGAKPATFCGWLFRVLDAQPGDELVDVFPGSGGVSRAWAAYVAGDPFAVVDPDELSRLEAADPSRVDVELPFDVTGPA